MDGKWSIRSKDKEAPKDKEKVPPAPSADDYRASARSVIEEELRAIINEEIKTAARELAEEQKAAIRAAIEEQKRIIQEVLEQEKLAIRAQKEDVRRSVISLGMG